MDPSVLLAISIPLIGWIVVHSLSAWRDRVTRRHNTRASYLIETFLGLAKLWATIEDKLRTAEPLTDEEDSDFCTTLSTALRGVQLLGNRAQVRIVDDMLSALESGASVEFRDYIPPLLQDMRDDLRKSLGMRNIPNEAKWFNIKGIAMKPPGHG